MYIYMYIDGLLLTMMLPLFVAIVSFRSFQPPKRFKADTLNPLLGSLAKAPFLGRVSLKLCNQQRRPGRTPRPPKTSAKRLQTSQSWGYQWLMVFPLVVRFLYPQIGWSQVIVFFPRKMKPPSVSFFLRVSVMRQLCPGPSGMFIGRTSLPLLLVKGKTPQVCTSNKTCLKSNPCCCRSDPHFVVSWNSPIPEGW